MSRLRDILTRLLNLLAGVSFLVMVVLTCWQVLTRYVLNAPSSWSEELVSYMFAWMSLLGASIVTAERGHMNIPILVEKTSPMMQNFFACLSEVLAFLFSAIILAYCGFVIANLAMGQMSSYLGVPIGVFYIVLPLCGLLNMVYTVLNIADILKKKEGTV